MAQELIDAVGFERDQVLFASAKSGEGVAEILEAIVRRVPPPAGDPEAPLRALVFDAKYDPYRGVLVYVRVMDGRVDARQPLRLMQQQRRFEPLETGCFRPQLDVVPQLEAGEVGYVATGLKGVDQSRVGDTVTTERRGAQGPLPGYRPAKPMVFAAIYPTDPDAYPRLREALERLSLNDASLGWQPESSAALGFGFRCGFLGLLHMEIVQERLEREFDLELIATAPSVEYELTRTDGEEIVVDSPAELPPANEIAEVREPWVRLSITAPARHLGAVMGLVEERRGEHVNIEYLDYGGDYTNEEGDSRVLAEYLAPLSEIVVDFYGQLKARTQGYASLDYQFEGYRPAKVVRLDVLVNGDPIDALSTIIQSERAAVRGRRLVAALKGADPAPAVRRPDPGRRRRPHPRPRDGARAAQERAREVLRRRRHPQAQAAGGAEGGQEADEDAGPGGDPAGGVHGSAAAAGLIRRSSESASGGDDCFGLDLDLPAGVQEPRHDDHRRRGTNVAKGGRVSPADSLRIVTISQGRFAFEPRRSLTSPAPPAQRG